MADPAGNTEKKRRGVLGDLVTVETMLQAALVLPIACVLGWWLGTLLDRHFHTSWISIVGILMGAVGGFLQIFRLASAYLKRNHR